MNNIENPSCRELLEAAYLEAPDEIAADILEITVRLAKLERAAFESRLAKIEELKKLPILDVELAELPAEMQEQVKTAIQEEISSSRMTIQACSWEALVTLAESAPKKSPWKWAVEQLHAGGANLDRVLAWLSKRSGENKEYVGLIRDAYLSREAA